MAKSGRGGAGRTGDLRAGGDFGERLLREDGGLALGTGSRKAEDRRATTAAAAAGAVLKYSSTPASQRWRNYWLKY